MTHCIRVRLAQCVYNTSAALTTKRSGQNGRNSYDANIFDTLELGHNKSASKSQENGAPRIDEEKVLETIADTLARLGRVKRVSLGVAQKDDFVKTWTKRRTK